MAFRQFAFHNVFRNKRLYIAYFLSSLFTVMVFFTFVNFAFHPELSEGEIHNSVTQGMIAAGGIIYVFSFFFILYSMSSFLQSRKKEFGLLIIQGMTNAQIRWMVFLENMIIGFFATIIGIGLGLVFSKAILLVAENLLVLEDTLYFYFPTTALLTTFISFMILFFLISIFVTFVLRTKRLVKLIKGDKIGKTEPKTSKFLIAVAILLLGIGYGIALYVKGAAVVLALIPVVILVVIGTYFLFTQLSVLVIRKLKNNQALFWKKTNMLLFSDLSFRMKDNARAFFMVAIISTVAFSAIGTLYGFSSLLTGGVKEANPYTFTYTVAEDEEVPALDQTFDQYNLSVNEALTQLNYYEQDGENVLIVTPEEYNTFAQLIGEKTIELGANDITAVEGNTANMLFPIGDLEDATIEFTDGTSQQVNVFNIAERNILPGFNRYFIVGSNIMDQLDEPTNATTYAAWQVIKGSNDDIIEAGSVLSEEYFGLMAIDFTVYEMNKIWSPILFVGLFIGIVFFVSAGSFLYFRLYTDLDEDKEKFRAISKLGLTSREMNAVIGKQIAILFFTPIIVALIHGAVALTALSHMFDHNLFFESSIVLGSFLAIQIVYFIVVRYFYTKQVRQFVQG